MRTFAHGAIMVSVGCVAVVGCVIAVTVISYGIRNTNAVLMVSVNIVTVALVVIVKMKIKGEYDER